MISFANINKQHGKQLLFVDASFQLNPDEKVGGKYGGKIWGKTGRSPIFRRMEIGERPVCPRSFTPPPPTLRFPERAGVALRSDLAHDNHQNSNFLFRLR
jgi:hypothetical protein